MQHRKKNRKCWVEYVDVSIVKPSFCNDLNRNSYIILFLCLFLVLLQFDIKNVSIICLTSFVLIIILYYKQKEKMNPQTIENFDILYTKNTPVRKCSDYQTRINYNCKVADKNPTPSVQPDISRLRKVNYNTTDYNLSFAKPTDNQSLVGKPNPKTLIPPIIAPHLTSFEEWKNDDDYNISALNVKRNLYDSESGYDSQTVCQKVNYMNPKAYYCGYKKIRETQPDVLPVQPIQQPTSKIETFELPFEIKEQNPEIFTTRISDLNYKTHDGKEPINSNIGITETQQFEQPKYEYIEQPENINMSNTYDPRFYGYGTSYRGYFDEKIGQPRYYYDDVDSIKMPNYITRSKIDMTPFGDAYGPDNGSNSYHGNIKQLADNHYHNSTMQFRTEMQERLMRKVNAEQWQQKMFPINKNGQRMMK
jgi:hypothetical protein